MAVVNLGSMKGLGDNIYQRAFVKQLYPHTVFLDTPWPQLYSDMSHVRFVRSNTTLRTQAKNVNRSVGFRWHNPPIGIKRKQIFYPEGRIIQGMISAFGCKPSKFDLPSFTAPVIKGGKYVVIRPATIRTEWMAASRNPDPEYINFCAARLRELGYTVVSVADLVPDREWIVGPDPVADIKFHNGELTVTDLMGLVENASAVIGGIGWIVPACIAYNVPAFILCGGQGGYNSPTNITDPTYQDLSKMEFAVPDKFCMCKLPQHTCDKTISNLPIKFENWIDRIGLKNGPVN